MAGASARGSQPTNNRCVGDTHPVLSKRDSNVDTDRQPSFLSGTLLCRMCGRRMGRNGALGARAARTPIKKYRGGTARRPTSPDLTGCNHHMAPTTTKGAGAGRCVGQFRYQQLADHLSPPPTYRANPKYKRCSWPNQTPKITAGRGDCTGAAHTERRCRI